VDAGRSFIAVYRWRVAAEHEQRFHECWRLRTLQLRDRGALGSCLTREAGGEFVAIALWPSEAARAEAFREVTSELDWPPVEGGPSLSLTVVDDLWVRSAFDLTSPG
jgi:hypothetical protein